jgi:SAM-dependent methyltransferase
LKGPKYGLEGIDQNSYDFVYSDNVLEHTPNPIFALVEQLRVTKIGGYVYVVIPNKAYTFDRNRATTSIDLLIEKYQQDIFHYSVDEALDIILNTEDFPGELIINSSPLDFAKKMISENNGEYHFHVFDSQNILLLLDYVCLLTNSRLRYFSAPNRKHIHFAICKGAVE